MATRQYIGARYVPLFYNGTGGSAEWTANTQYEALTIVTRNGNSYTSRKQVPANIGAPESNADYWVSTGMYNEQVEQYRQETQGVADDLDTLEASVTASLGAMQTQIDEIEESVTEKPNVIMIGDSYGHASGGGYGWIDKLQAKMNIASANLFAYAGSGSGFNRSAAGVDSFNTIFNNIVGNMSAEAIENVGTVIICGGSNDIGVAATTLKTDVIETVTNVVNRCANAKVYVGEVSGNISNHFATAQLPRILEAYRAASTVKNVYYLNNVEYCLHDRDHLNADLIHPNNDGYEIITNAIYAALKGSYNYSYYNSTVVVAAPSNANVSNNLFVIDINNEKAQLTNTLPLDVQFTAPVNFGIGQTVTLGQLSTKAMLGCNDSYYGYNRTVTQIEAFVYNSAGTFMWNTLCELWIDETGLLKIRNRDYERVSGTSGYNSINRIFITTRFQISAPSNAC